MKLSRLFAVVVVGSSMAGFALADHHKAGENPEGMVTATADSLKWVDAPPGLPKGAKVALLHGDPSKPGLFVMRAKLPANYKIPAHWHPAEEILTILTGTFYLGHGDKLDTKEGKAHPAGSFISMPPKMHHFAYTKKETIIQLSTVGPWGITYINPADDPRGTAAAAAPAPAAAAK